MLCNTHTREMLRSLPAAAACLLLLCCCSAAQVQLVWLCNHWVRLHCCTLPCCSSSLAAPLVCLGLAWVEEFNLSLSLELAWLGFMEISGIFYKSSNFTNCPVLFSSLVGRKLSFTRITIQVGKSRWFLTVPCNSTNSSANVRSSKSKTL